MPGATSGKNLDTVKQMLTHFTCTEAANLAAPNLSKHLLKARNKVTFRLNLYPLGGNEVSGVKRKKKTFFLCGEKIDIIICKYDIVSLNKAQRKKSNVYDIDARCNKWKKSGYCEANAHSLYMYRSCKFSCPKLVKAFTEGEE